MGLFILLLAGSTSHLMATTATDTRSASDTVGASPAYDIHHPIAALKNNLLYDAAATPNLQLEFRLAEHWTLQAGVGFNPFPLDDKVLPKWRHVSVELAPRYWLCEAFSKDFVSVNIGYTHFNVAGGVYPIGWMYRGVQENRYQGDALLFGASYGWHFALSPHFSIELEGGVDAGVAWYDRFKCKHCGEKLAYEKKWFALPRLGVNLVVVLDGNQVEFEDRCDCKRLAVSGEKDTVSAPAHNEPSEISTVDVPEQSIEDTISESEPDTMMIIMFDHPDEQRSVAEPEYILVPRAKPDTRYVADSLAALSERIKALEEAYMDEPSDSLYDAIVALLDKQDEIAHLDQMSRLRSAVLRPLSEFTPYDPEAPVTSEPNSIYMHFDVNSTDVDRTFIHNDELLDSIMTIIAEAIEDSTIEIKLIKIIGMASFDGSQKNNERLGAIRAEALHDYVQERFGFDKNMFRVYNGGECWAELRWYLDYEQFEGKHDILCIIDQVLDYDLRERFIKQHNNGRTYEYMRTHFKRYLRNLGSITVYYERKDL